MERLHDILDKLKTYLPEADVSIVQSAYVFSAMVHRGQLRKSGEPYLYHPLAVASILADFRMDPATIAAGLLHDSIEDTSTTEEELGRTFGEDVRNLVMGVTKIAQVPFSSLMEKEAVNYRRMILAMASDIRVLIIKLADRLHNLRTLEHLSEPQRKRIAQESLDIYAPLANRLGMGTVKAEMEDLSFRHLHPEIFADIAARVEARRRERDRYVKEAAGVVAAKLAESGIKATVVGRAKHYYSIYMKMQKQHLDFDEVHDLLALRVITDSVRDCYGALGIIHTLLIPVPGRFKDYIAMPKENMYQSLHTTVVGSEGERIEFQIRTEEMHRFAEEGIAAHWKYKEGLKGAGGEDGVKWLRQSLDWLKDLKDPHEFLESFKMDLYPEEVYVFTPKGDVRSFARGATPIDFAYAVHTHVGHTCVGARVNGRIVPIRYQLRNGDKVEILTQAGHHPSKDWLKFAVTSRARAKIRLWLKQEQREQSISLGRDMLDKELRRYNTGAAKVLKSREAEAGLAAMGYRATDDLLAAMGNGKITASAAARKLLPADSIPREPPPEGALQKIARGLGLAKGKPGGIKVDGLDNVLIHFARCCNPVPGDRIVGFITRGRGISVHAADCANVLQLVDESRHRVEVEWDTDHRALFPVRVVVEASDRQGLLGDLTECISDAEANISSVQMKSVDGKARGEIEIIIRDTDQLNRIVGAMRRIKGVETVFRAKSAVSAAG